MDVFTILNSDADPDSDRNLSAPVRLAWCIACRIIDQDVAVGTRLGSLPEVTERHGVSVPTLRKAIGFRPVDLH